MIHASLFSGIGGPEVAAQMIGWENAFHCEINPFGRAVLDYWFPESKSYDDITKTSFKEWFGRIDVLTGGFPCQPFSYAGKRGGRNDDRYLWPEMLRAIGEIRPTWVVGENVTGITTMVEGGVLSELGSDSYLFQKGDELHRYELEQPFTIERICKDLECIGYSVQPLLVPAASVGAPHRRDRIFVIAHEDSSDTKSEQGDRNRPYEPDSCEKGEIEFGRRNSKDFGSSSHATDLFGDGRGVRHEGELGRGKISKSRNGNWADGLYPGRRWEGFPTISPIHRGNDGLPFDVDNLSIPFSKWRTESLKAYGNAIVPQVMFRIFQAIEAVEKEKTL